MLVNINNHSIVILGRSTVHIIESLLKIKFPILLERPLYTQARSFRLVERNRP